MADYLQRELSPLSEEQWQTIDGVVTSVGQRQLVGRRFIALLGPLGPGVQTIADDRIGGAELGAVDLLGDDGQTPAQAVHRRYITLPLIYKDFRLHWRDVETSRQFRVPVDSGLAAAAAAFCARAEDNMIFNGHAALSLEGLLTAEGRQVVPLSDWARSGAAFEDIVAATQRLVAAGFFGPFALAVSPRLYASMHRVHADTGVLEIEQVSKIASAGVFQTPVIPDDRAVVVSTGAENMDLVLAQDLVTSFLQTSHMNHLFRVFEIVALRIKRPGAIVALESGAPALPAVPRRRGRPPGRGAARGGGAGEEARTP
ncbi:MAG: bacteriocin family protein [Chloroflexi bacterium]|nr:bacteriocin family protein [Chloroflexota bacterium]